MLEQRKRIKLEGQVIKAIRGGIFIVRLKNDFKVSTRLCGKLKKKCSRKRVRIRVGDTVIIEPCDYDPTQGRILEKQNAK